MREEKKIKPKAKFGWLLVWLFGQMLAAPLFEGSLFAGAVADLFFYSMLLIAVVSIRKGRLFPLAIIFFTATLAGYAGFSLLQKQWMVVVTNFFSAGFTALVALQIVLYIAYRQSVGRQAIMGALCAYILIGICWTMLFINTELLQPGSFDFGPHGPDPDLIKMIILLYYYSFVTLLSIGYGDITPMSHMAQSLTIMEGIIGQFYLVFFMATLVGLYIYQRENRHLEDG